MSLAPSEPSLFLVRHGPILVEMLFRPMVVGFSKWAYSLAASFCGTQAVRLGLCSIGSVKISHTTVRCLKQFPVTRYAILVKLSVSNTSSVFRSSFVDTPKWCINTHPWHQHIYLERCRTSQRSVRRLSNDRLLMFSSPLVVFNKSVRSQPKDFYFMIVCLISALRPTSMWCGFIPTPRSTCNLFCW